jgi:chemotaxis protein methyltransferase CheR
VSLVVPSHGDAWSEALAGISPGIYTREDFRAVSEMVHAEAGIVLPTGKAMLVYSRLAPLVRNSNSGTFAAYVARMRENDAERLRAVNALTTNHTFFFREDHHFAHFAQDVRPAMLRRLESGGPVRIWSAGCSSGEETWSLGMTLLGEDHARGIAIARRDLRILASDLAERVLTKARDAHYTADNLKTVPDPLRRAWTVTDPAKPPMGATAGATIADPLRAIVRFRMLNLLGEWPMRGTFDVIFCRNVMIYFDTETKERLVDRFADRIAPGGFLYIGHSERVTGPATRKLRLVGPTIYQRTAA